MLNYYYEKFVSRHWILNIKIPSEILACALLFTVYTVHTVYTVCNIYTVYNAHTVYAVQTALHQLSSCMYACIYILLGEG